MARLSCSRRVASVFSKIEDFESGMVMRSCFRAFFDMGSGPFRVRVNPYASGNCLKLPENHAPDITIGRYLRASRGRGIGWFPWNSCSILNACSMFRGEKEPRGRGFKGPRGGVKSEERNAECKMGSEEGVEELRGRGAEGR